MLLGKLRAAGKRYSRHAWRRKRTGSMQADVVWDGRGGCEVRQVAAMGCQKLCHPKSKDLRTPNYPTPSSPLSRLQPYVLPSESAAAQPPSRCAVAAAALIRDAARIATSEQSRQRAPLSLVAHQTATPCWATVLLFVHLRLSCCAAQMLLVPYSGAGY